MDTAMGFSQILSLIFFIAAAFAIAFFAKRYAPILRARLHDGKRIQIIEEISLSHQDRMRLIKIDGREFIHLSGKAGQQGFYSLPSEVQPAVEVKPQAVNTLRMRKTGK